MTAPEIDSDEGIKIGDVIIHAGNVDGRDLSVDGSKLDGVETGADVTDSTNVNSAGAVMNTDFSGSEGFMRKTGSGTYTMIKSNMSAVVPPTVNDDTGDGYAIGSRWIDTSGDIEYVCTDPSSGAAVWGCSTPITYDIATSTTKQTFSSFSTGTDIYHAHDAQIQTNSTTYVKGKTITLDILPSSSLQIHFGVLGNSIYVTGTARIYRNGVAVGTERSATSVGWEGTETISGWSKGDTLELWYHGDSSGPGFIKNFRILGTAVSITNS